MMVLIDYSKAFDCVHHSLLLKKLRNLGFSAHVVQWLSSYLGNRCQSVKFGGRSSGYCIVERGVPQGSVLGPLLFSIYIDDVTNIFQYSKLHLYADDLQLYIHFDLNNFAATVDKMNLDLDALTDWTYRHGLRINETKSKAIIIGYTKLTTRRGIDFSRGPFIQINNKNLPYSDSVRNLGLIVDKNLDWTEQINVTCKKVFASIHSLKKIGDCIPFRVKVMLVKSLIFPYFNYGDIVVNDMSVVLSERLQRAHNYSIRFIFNLRRDDHISPYFQQLGLLKLRPVRQYHVLMLLYDLINFKRPGYLANQFIFIRQRSGRGTRHGSQLLVIPNHRTSMYNKSFHVTACRTWNQLPVAIKSVNGRALFGVAVLNWLRGGGMA